MWARRDQLARVNDFNAMVEATQRAKSRLEEK